MKKLIDAVIKGSKGRFVTVTFTKKDGTTRRVNGRIGVRFGKEAAPARYDGKGQPYFLLWEVRSRGYKRINADAVQRVATDGVVLYDAFS